jgi:hypothetical protein
MAGGFAKNWYAPVIRNEARAQLHMTAQDEAELNERIRVALGYMAPAKIANYLGVTLHRVEEVRNRTPYFRIKGLRDQVKQGVRRG